MVYKLLKKIGLRYCYYCGRLIWWRDLTWRRVIESPKDEYGIKVAMHRSCWEDLREKYGY